MRDLAQNTKTTHIEKARERERERDLAQNTNCILQNDNIQKPLQTWLHTS